MTSFPRFADVVWFSLTGLAAFALALAWAGPIAAAFTAYLAITMAAITLSDLRAFIVPDMLSLPAIPAGIAANLLVMHDVSASGLTQSLWGIGLGGGTLYLVRAIHFRLRKIEGLGLGDVKLGAAAGAWLGPGLLAPACLAATLSALLAVLILRLPSGKKNTQELQIPFGSFIAPVIVLFWAFRLWGLEPPTP